MKKIALIFIIIFFTTLCTKQVEESSGIILIDVDIKTSKETTIETLFSGIEVIPLETTENSLLKKCGKILFIHNKFFVLDEEQHAIFIFDIQGNFIKNSLHKEGEGPGEYRSMTDFDINPQIGNIEILDVSSYKIRRYDENFNSINETKLPKKIYPIAAFKIIKSDLLVFYSPQIDSNNERLVFFNTSKNEIIGKIDLQSFMYRLPTTQRYPFYMKDSYVFFTNRYPNNYIFEILYNEKKIKQIVEYDFGKNTIRLNDKSEKSLENNSFIENNKNFVFPLTKYENDSSIFSFVRFKENLHLVSYNKKSKQTTVVNSKFKDGGMILPPVFIDNNYFYILAQPNWVGSIIKKSLLDKNSQKNIEVLKEDDNPVIIKYKLRTN